jgi:hypothetical protein
MVGTVACRLSVGFVLVKDCYAILLQLADRHQVVHPLGKQEASLPKI